MAKVMYTAEAKVTGGRASGHGETSDGALTVDLTMPGAGGGTNPEQLFAIGYAACFEGALGVVGMRTGAEASDAIIDIKVDLISDESHNYTIGAKLDVTLPSIQDADKAREVVAAAHQVCPYSKATRGNIEVELSANGQPV